jgi:predicted AAA+ superfamily ATPase
MEIERNIFNELKVWKSRKERKPLLLQGARQAGKPWLLKRFGKECFEDSAYFNFDRQPELKPLFDGTKDPDRLLQQLALVHGKPIHPDSRNDDFEL